MRPIGFAQSARLDNLVIKACMRGTLSRLAEWLSALGTWGTRLAGPPVAHGIFDPTPRDADVGEQAG
jgi:hypothetical protein